ncbi:hypothetical protein [Kitasatospora sp. NPDC094011]|uniref:hypothetical protein n=1 Tax=Kitasatospora sp. NPDC094011 TaxID=3364090 RepID=UPI0037FFA20F
MSASTGASAAEGDSAGAEDEWLNGLADEAEAEGLDGAVGLDEMAALLGIGGPMIDP